MAFRAESGFSAYIIMEQQQNIKHLVRVANTDFDGFKPVHNALLRIQGVGAPFATMVCFLAKVDKLTKVGTLPESEIKKLDDVMANPLKHGAPIWMLNRRKDYDTNEDRHVITGDLIFVTDNDIKRLKKIKAYRGVRHTLGQPTRGQRTRSNFRKNKGKVRLGVIRKKEAAPAASKDAKPAAKGKDKK